MCQQREGCAVVTDSLIVTTFYVVKAEKHVLIPFLVFRVWRVWVIGASPWGLVTWAGDPGR